jgi:hypothetical protein
MDQEYGDSRAKDRQKDRHQRTVDIGTKGRRRQWTGNTGRSTGRGRGQET